MFTIQSAAFADHAPMPRTYTARGDNVSPPLAWAGAPAGTRSFTLIVEDPDAPDPEAPQRTWVHWVLYDLPPEARALPAGAALQGLPPGARRGINDWNRSDYGGPAPPIGRHRYFHRLYALDTVLPKLEHPTKANLLAAMQGHVIEETAVVGTFEQGTA